MPEWHHAALRWVRAALAACVILFPHGNTPSHSISPHVKDLHLYPFPAGYATEHYAYSVVVVAAVCVSLQLDTRTDHTARGFLALAIIGLLPTWGVYLAHSTNHGNATQAGPGVWAIVLFAHSALFV